MSAEIMRQCCTESYDTMLGGKVGRGAIRTDNEGQTLAGMGVVAVGGLCLEATAAGGF